jgi:hypothetical protein
MNNEELQDQLMKKLEKVTALEAEVERLNEIIRILRLDIHKTGD